MHIYKHTVFYRVYGILYCSLVQDSREYYLGTNVYKKTYREEWKTKLLVFAVTCCFMPA